MEFFYSCSGKSGTVKASSALNAAKKIMGKRAKHLYGDPKVEYAIYQGDFRDNDDYDQCTIKLSSERRIPFFHKLIWSTLSAWMLFCVINLSALLYDIDMFRSLIFKLTGFQSPSLMIPSSVLTETVAYKKN